MMNSKQPWRLFDDELDRWQANDRTASFWLRDDDAVIPTDLLEQLVGLTARQTVPLTLAVIPQDTGAALAERIASASHVSVAVHGWSHQNHAGKSEKKQELGLHRPKAIVLDELQNGFDKLADLYGQQFNAMLVPPWNRIDADLLPELASLGYRSVSVFGAEKPAPIRKINTHVDLIDWHGSRGGRDPEVLITEIVARLRIMFDQSGHVGFLTHHLVHDQAAWSFLASLFERSNAHPACRWVHAAELQE
jgi:peptidoglycan/xylan/chitin deacetylase (PgdA/CDA1 family)